MSLTGAIVPLRSSPADCDPIVDRARSRDIVLLGQASHGTHEFYRLRAEITRRLVTTYTGTVTAASDWDAPAERKRVRPAFPDSCELLFHDLGAGDFLLDCAALAKPRLERAIGVIYGPETERISHYFKCAIAEQFDTCCTSTRPARSSRWNASQLPATPSHLRRTRRFF